MKKTAIEKSRIIFGTSILQESSKIRFDAGTAEGEQKSPYHSIEFKDWGSTVSECFPETAMWIVAGIALIMTAALDRVCFWTGRK